MSPLQNSFLLITARNGHALNDGDEFAATRNEAKFPMLVGVQAKKLSEQTIMTLPARSHFRRG